MTSRTAIAWILALWTIGAPSPVRAGEYESGFGFGISVPDIWLVLTRSQVVERVELLFGGEGSTGLESVPMAVRRMVYDRVRAGELEIYYRRTAEAGSFVDNVNVMAQMADLPATPAQLTGICRALPHEFSRAFGRPIAMDVCEIRQRIGRRALYLQFDGAIPGTTTLHYQLQFGSGRTLVFTATAATQDLPRIMHEFEGMIASIRMR